MRTASTASSTRGSAAARAAATIRSTGSTLGSSVVLVDLAVADEYRRPGVEGHEAGLPSLFFDRRPPGEQHPVGDQARRSARGSTRAASGRSPGVLAGHRRGPQLGARDAGVRGGPVSAGIGLATADGPCR